MTYEEKIKRVREILQILQEHSTEYPLEQLIAFYEESQRLLAECEKFLEETELRLSKLNFSADSDNVVD